jgi:hypothetical protein
MGAKAVTSKSIASRLDHLDWTKLRKELSEYGFALTEQILSPTECDSPH